MLQGTCGVPTMWLTRTDWMERQGRTLPHLRTVYSTGAAAPRSLLDKLASWGVELNQLREQFRDYKLPTAERGA